VELTRPYESADIAAAASVEALWDALLVPEAVGAELARQLERGPGADATYEHHEHGWVQRGPLPAGATRAAVLDTTGRWVAPLVRDGGWAAFTLGQFVEPRFEDPAGAVVPRRVHERVVEREPLAGVGTPCRVCGGTTWEQQRLAEPAHLASRTVARCLTCAAHVDLHDAPMPSAPPPRPRRAPEYLPVEAWWPRFEAQSFAAFAAARTPLLELAGWAGARAWSGGGGSGPWVVLEHGGAAESPRCAVTTTADREHRPGPKRLCDLLTSMTVPRTPWWPPAEVVAAEHAVLAAARRAALAPAEEVEVRVEGRPVRLLAARLDDAWAAVGPLPGAGCALELEVRGLEPGQVMLRQATDLGAYVRPPAVWPPER
jgi:hypothetical protein